MAAGSERQTRTLMGMQKRKEQERLQKQEKRASHRTNEGVFPKLAEQVDGAYCIKDDPLLVVHVEEYSKVKKTEEHEAERIREGSTPKSSRCQTIAMCCWVMLFMAGGDGDDPLFLQVKEADASTLAPYFGKSAYVNHGERVVQGQRVMQESSDIFLGWTHGEVADLYVRQLRDMKMSANIALSLDMSYRPTKSKVSQTRTGQGVSIRSSAPGFLCKEEGKLIEG